MTRKTFAEDIARKVRYGSEELRARTEVQPGLNPNVRIRVVRTQSTPGAATPSFADIQRAERKRMRRIELALWLALVLLLGCLAGAAFWL